MLKVNDLLVKDLAEIEEKFRRYSLAVEQNPASIVITDINGNIDYVNKKFTALTGYSLEEVKSKNSNILKSGNTPQEVYCNLWKTILSGEEWRGEFHNKKKNGELFWEYALISPIKDPYGKVTHFLGIKEDITEKKKTFEALKESEHKYHELIENSVDGIFIADSEGNVKLVNIKGCEILGYTKEELLGMNLKDTYPQADLDNFETNLKILITSGVHIYERRIKRGDGRIIPAELTVRKIKDNGFQAIIRDISERKKYEEKIQLQANMLDQVGQAIIATDVNGIITYFNKKAEKLYKWNEKDCLGKNIMDVVFSDTSKEKVAETRSYIKRGDCWKGEVSIERKDKSSFPAYITVSPIYDSEKNILGVAGISFDLTEQKKKEEELTEAKKKAEEMNKLKSTFLANMSHELRTPMVGILGFAELLLNDKMEAYQAEMIKDIYESGKRLLNTLNLILDFSKIESDKIEIKYCDIDCNKFVEETVSVFRKTAQLKNLTLAFNPYDDGLKITSDRTILKNILSNLIHNAVKFTNLGSINVSLNKETLMETEYAVFSVSDTGIGIPIENQKIIFDEFRQGDEGSSRHFEGTGLGLTLTKKYISLLNGFISLKSAKGVGSTFYVYIPLEINKSGNSDNISLIPSNISQLNQEDHKLVLPRILLVENDDISISLIQIYLKNFCQLDIAKNIQSALLISEKNTYDLVLMDIHLGELMNGIDLTKILRNNSKYEGTPIIACTAYAMESEMENFIASGCTDFISKPFTKEELRIKVMKNLKKGLK